MSLILLFALFLPESTALPVAVIVASSFALGLSIYATAYHKKRDVETALLKGGS